MINNCFFISTAFWHDHYTVPEHFRALAETLAVDGKDVVLLVSSWQEPFSYKKENLSVYTWPSRKPKTLKDAIFLARLIKKYRPVCVMAGFGAINLILIIGSIYRTSIRMSWYHTMSKANELDIQFSKWKIWYQRLRKRYIYKLATHIIAVSKAADEDIDNLYGVPVSNRRVFYNSLEDPLVRLSGYEEVLPRATIVCVGRLYPTKGQDILIRALVHLSQLHPEIVVEFIGDGPQKANYTALAHKLGVEKHCSFLGSLSHDDVLKKMRAAAITVVPSRMDNCPLTVLESLACGVPIVASNVGGIPELIRDGIDGILVESENPRHLSDACAQLLSDTQLMNTMKENAREQFLQNFERTGAIARQVLWLEEISAPFLPVNRS